MTSFGVRRAKAAFSSGCESHPAILLQQESIGSVMEGYHPKLAPCRAAVKGYDFYGWWARQHPLPLTR
jgi:hypothetical protein